MIHFLFKIGQLNVFYSERKDFTGLAVADFTALKAKVKDVMTNVINVAKANIHHLIAIL